MNKVGIFFRGGGSDFWGGVSPQKGPAGNPGDAGFIHFQYR